MSPMEEVAFSRVTHSSISPVGGVGGRVRGTIAIFPDALESSREHFSAVTSAVTCCWPLGSFKRKGP